MYASAGYGGYGYGAPRRTGIGSGLVAAALGTTAVAALVGFLLCKTKTTCSCATAAAAPVATTTVAAAPVVGKEHLVAAQRLPVETVREVDVVTRQRIPYHEVREVFQGPEVDEVYSSGPFEYYNPESRIVAMSFCEPRS